MSQLPKYFEPDRFPRSDVQDMLDEAQLDAGSRFADIPCLRDQLQEYFQWAIEECNRREVDPMEILHRAMFIERAILDAYNKHRLGNAITQFSAQVPEPENAVEYKAVENIPEVLAWFPLRAAVSRRGVLVRAPPIYQVEEPAEARQQYTPKPNVVSKAPARINDTREKTINNSAAKAKKTRGFGSPNYNKLRGAPSPWLSFPSGNLTMAEITAFIPQAIKSVNVIDRLLYNGALSATLADMINYYRTMPLGPIENNSIYRMMKAPMDVRAKTEPIYQFWTVTKHATITKPAGFDPTSVSVANFRAPQKYHSCEAASAAQQPPTILFRDMAEGVKIMPYGYDALDLTRCIEYCVDNKDEDWYYPQDFARLVSHLGGAVAVHREHQDAAAIARHASGMRTNNAERIGTRQNDSHGLWKQVKAFVDSSDEEKTSGSESDESMDSDNDENDIIAVCMSDTNRKKTVSFEDMDVDGDKDDDDTIVVCTKGIKRNRAVSFDEADEGSRSSSKLSKRHKKDAPSGGRKAILPDNIDSESDGDVYVGPKNTKKASVATRSSSRHRRFNGSYNIDGAFDSEVEDE